MLWDFFVRRSSLREEFVWGLDIIRESNERLDYICFCFVMSLSRVSADEIGAPEEVDGYGLVVGVASAPPFLVPVVLFSLLSFPFFAGQVIGLRI